MFSGFQRYVFSLRSWKGCEEEVSSGRPASRLFVQGVAPSSGCSLGTKTTRRLTKDVREYKGGLPGFKLRKTTELMAAHLEEEFRSDPFWPGKAGMSEFHFSRLFKRTTGLNPFPIFHSLKNGEGLGVYSERQTRA